MTNTIFGSLPSAAKLRLGLVNWLLPGNLRQKLMQAYAMFLLFLGFTCGARSQTFNAQDELLRNCTQGVAVAGYMVNQDWEENANMENIIREELQRQGIPVVAGYPDLSRHLRIQVLWSPLHLGSGLSMELDEQYIAYASASVPVLYAKEGTRQPVGRATMYDTHSTFGFCSGFQLMSSAMDITRIMAREFAEACRKAH